MSGSENNPTLDYAATLPPPRKLTLVEWSDGFTLAFPVLPTSIWLLSLLVATTPALVALILAARRVPEVLALMALVPENAFNIALAFFVVFGLPTLLTTSLVAVYAVIIIRKGRRDPHTLAITQGRIIWRRPGFWNVRHNEWPVEQIRQVQVTQVKDLFTSKTVADLLIRFHHGWPLRLRLRTDDPELPRRVEQLLRQSMQCAATIAQSSPAPLATDRPDH